MAQYLPTQDILQQYRSAIEEVVGQLNGDNALLTALHALKRDSDNTIKELSGKMAELENKLSNKKVLYALKLWKFLIKVYPE